MLHAQPSPDRLPRGDAARRASARSVVDDRLQRRGEGALATEALLSRDELRPTAIVYSNDHMAVAGLGVAQRRGLVVPRDLSITGFDDTELGRYLHPALTSVATDARAWGAVAARTLLDADRGQRTPVRHPSSPHPPSPCAAPPGPRRPRLRGIRRT